MVCLFLNSLCVMHGVLINFQELLLFSSSQFRLIYLLSFISNQSITTWLGCASSQFLIYVLDRLLIFSLLSYPLKIVLPNLISDKNYNSLFLGIPKKKKRSIISAQMPRGSTSSKSFPSASAKSISHSPLDFSSSLLSV